MLHQMMVHPPGLRSSSTGATVLTVLRVMGAIVEREWVGWGAGRVEEWEGGGRAKRETQVKRQLREPFVRHKCGGTLCAPLPAQRGGRKEKGLVGGREAGPRAVLSFVLANKGPLSLAPCGLRNSIDSDSSSSVPTPRLHVPYLRLRVPSVHASPLRTTSPPSSSMGQLALSIFSGLLVLLNAGPLYWQLYQGNSGPIAMGVWVIVYNLMDFVSCHSRSVARQC